MILILKVQIFHPILAKIYPKRIVRNNRLAHIILKYYDFRKSWTVGFNDGCGYISICKSLNFTSDVVYNFIYELMINNIDFYY